MIQKLVRSIKTRGVGGTVRAVGGMTPEWIRHPRLAQHAPVPWAMLKNPRHAAGWVHDRLSSSGPATQGLPWIAWPCIDFMSGYLKPAHRVFEWGGGGSTVFFIDKGCSVTTVESASEWVEQLEGQISKRGGDGRSRWSLRFVAVSGNSDPNVEEYIRQVAIGAPWDLVMVDGWSRRRCLDAAIEHVKLGGVLVLDNADQEQYASVPEAMLGRGWKRHKFRGLGVARSWITQTDAYVRPMAPAAR